MKLLADVCWYKSGVGRKLPRAQQECFVPRGEIRWYVTGTVACSFWFSVWSFEISAACNWIWVLSSSNSFGKQKRNICFIWDSSSSHQAPVNLNLPGQLLSSLSFPITMSSLLLKHCQVFVEEQPPEIMEPTGMPMPITLYCESHTWKLSYKYLTIFCNGKQKILLSPACKLNFWCWHELLGKSSWFVFRYIISMLWDWHHHQKEGHQWHHGAQHSILSSVGRHSFCPILNYCGSHSSAESMPLTFCSSALCSMPPELLSCEDCSVPISTCKDFCNSNRNIKHKAIQSKHSSVVWTQSEILQHHSSQLHRLLPGTVWNKKKSLLEPSLTIFVIISYGCTMPLQGWPSLYKANKKKKRWKKHSTALSTSSAGITGSWQLFGSHQVLNHSILLLELPLQLLMPVPPVLQLLSQFAHFFQLNAIHLQRVAMGIVVLSVLS